VHAALTLPWSTGPVEGQINRLRICSQTGRAGRCFPGCYFEVNEG
jgi:hypothetical protein